MMMMMMIIIIIIVYLFVFNSYNIWVYLPVNTGLS